MELCELEAALSDPDAPEAAALVRAMEDEIEELYSDRPGSIHSVEASAGAMRPPDGGFLILRLAGAAIGCGGIKRIGEGICEIKRMYVVPEARGNGYARDLLTALEDLARELGYGKARLDTADRQPAAKHLYESAGYRSIPDYNGNAVARFWFEKEL